MKAWAVHGVQLPFGDEPVSWWIDSSGAVHDRPVAHASLLPGRFVLPGLADAHAHPAIGSGPAGLVPLDATAAISNLAAWAQAGITLVRDVGSAGGLTLQLEPGPGLPELQAAGRFLAPAGAGSRTARPPAPPPAAPSDPATAAPAGSPAPPRPSAPGPARRPRAPPGARPPGRSPPPVPHPGAPAGPAPSGNPASRVRPSA